MPSLQQDAPCPSPDIPATEILHRHSINSLLGMQNRVDSMASPPEGDTFMSLTELLGLGSQRAALQQTPRPQQRLYIPLQQRTPVMDDFPNSPEGGQTPRSIMPHYFPPRNASNSRAFGSFSEIGSGLGNVVVQQRSSPESDYHMSCPSPTPNMDNSISELMNCLNMTMQSSSRNYQYPQGSNSRNSNNGFVRDSRSHRSSPAHDEVKCRWAGCLPFRMRSPNANFSPKVFLGGLPWDITEASLAQTFKDFGPIRVEWPGKEQAMAQPKGYVYMIFESERHVRSLLHYSKADDSGNWYFRISSKKMRFKEVQVIPWALDDSNYVKSSSVKLDPSRTVFVGALHGMLSAEGLATIMNDLFDGVVYAGIDTDKHKYPIGSGRVTFNNSHSYMRAVSAAFVEIKTEKFCKKVQVDPYLEDSMCSRCNVQQGPYFCRDPKCFRYFCRSCWQIRHTEEAHQPLMRNSRSSVSSHSSTGSNHFSGHFNNDFVGAYQQMSQSAPTSGIINSLDTASVMRSNSNPNMSQRFKKHGNTAIYNHWNSSKRF